MGARPKVVVVMPAYNAAKTLHMTYADLPHEMVDLVILVDDGSKDETARIAKELGLELFVHNRELRIRRQPENVLPRGAEGRGRYHRNVVHIRIINTRSHASAAQIIRPIVDGEADVVLGSRLLGAGSAGAGHALVEVLPPIAFLTGLENQVFGLHLAEYHTGYRALPQAGVLECVNLLEMDSDDFIFDHGDHGADRGD